MKKLLLVLFTVVFSTGITLADEQNIVTSSANGTWTGDNSGYSATINGFTISYQKNTSTSDCLAPSSDHIRVYKGAKLVIAGANNETITKVVLNCTAKDKCVNMTVGDGTATADGDAKTITWEGSTTSFEAVASAGQVRVKSVDITYTTAGGVSKKSADLAFSETDYDLESGVDEFTAPTFTKATTAAVTFASDNESVAKVSADGVISLAGGLGTAVITATAAENDDYYAGTATCTVEVAEYNHYVKATTVESGKAYLIGAVLTDGTAFYAYPVGTSSTHGYLSGSTSKSADDIRVKKSYDDTFVFASETDGWTIKQSTDSRYLYQTGSYNSFNVDAAPTSGQYWTVSANSDGTQTITNTAVSKYIQYSPSYTSFGSYSSAQTNAILPTLYILKDTATGINGVAVDNNVVEQNDAIYNISGQRVSKSYKGLVIKNGKKYIQK